MTNDYLRFACIRCQILKKENDLDDKILAEVNKSLMNLNVFLSNSPAIIN